jgi:uncharacterized delta-60 repeat protein
MELTTRQQAGARARQGRRALAATFAIVLALVCASAAQANLGDLDPAFSGDGVALPFVGTTIAPGARFEALTTRHDGGPVLAGWARSATGVDEPIVAQLTPAGAPVANYGDPGPGYTRIGGTTTGRVLHGVALDASGRVLAAGEQASTAPNPQPIVMRLTTAGALDDSFLGGGIGAIAPLAGQAYDVAELANGKLLVAGYATSGGIDQFFVAQLNDDGSPDTTSGFGGPDGIATSNFPLGGQARAMAIAPDGSIVLAGYENQLGPVHVPALARFTPGGALDPGFDGEGMLTVAISNPEGASAGELQGVQVDAAGRITAAGLSGTHALIVRRLAGGAADAGFGAGGQVYATLAAPSSLADVVLEGDRAVVAGATSQPRGVSQFLLGALGSTGVPDAGLGGAPPGWRSFPSAAGGGAAAFATALGPSGTIYTAGAMGTPNQPFVARHRPNAAPAAVLAGPATIAAGAPAVFDASDSSDPEGQPLAYDFDLDGNGSYEFAGGDNPLAFRSFAAPGTYSVGVRVTDPRGATATAGRTIQVTPATAPVPQPVLHKQGVAKPLRGKVRYRLPGTKKFLPLDGLTAIPNGTEIDARHGRVLITVLHDASGALDGARFYKGKFIFRQGKGKTPITTLTLSGGSFKNCTRKPAAKSSAFAVAASVIDGPGTRRHRRVRRLWGDGRGRFRTRGRYGAATVRGTKWLTLDRCDGTKVRVVRGKVAVEDLVHPNRGVKLVTAGHKTFVPYKRGG